MPMAAFTLFVLGRLVGNRVTFDEEVQGLDIPEMGMPGYAAEPDDLLDDPTSPGLGAAPQEVPRPLPLPAHGVGSRTRF